MSAAMLRAPTIPPLLSLSTKKKGNCKITSTLLRTKNCKVHNKSHVLHTKQMNSVNASFDVSEALAKSPNFLHVYCKKNILCNTVKSKIGKLLLNLQGSTRPHCSRSSTIWVQEDPRISGYFESQNISLLPT